MDIKDLEQSSYAPYSGHGLCAVVKSINGHYYPGVRVENASFPLTINSAQSALFTCLSEGDRPKAIYVKDTSARDIEFWRNEFNVWVYPLKELEDTAFKDISLDIGRDIPDKLQKLIPKAVTPNSGFPVAALLNTEQGTVSGVNIECSEWSMGLCAERVAIAKALAYGFTGFKELYVHARGGEFSSPCGACRQVIFEHMPHNPVHLFHADHTHSMHYSGDLLPHSFRSSSLKKNQDY